MGQKTTKNEKVPPLPPRNPARTNANQQPPSRPPSTPSSTQFTSRQLSVSNASKLTWTPSETKKADIGRHGGKTKYLKPAAKGVILQEHERPRDDLYHLHAIRSAETERDIQEHEKKRKRNQQQSTERTEGGPVKTTKK